MIKLKTKAFKFNSKLVYPPQELPSNYVVGGTDAEDGLAPFQCSLQYGRQHRCGCAILSSKWIVTASHCLFSYDKSIFLYLHI